MSRDAAHAFTPCAAAGPQFIAEAEMIESEFDVDAQGRFFRTREVP